MYHHTELDTFRYVKPMKLRAKKLRQAAVKVPRAGDHTSRRIQYSLQRVCRDLRRRGGPRAFLNPILATLYAARR